MRSVNMLDWHAGQSLSLKPASLMAVPFARLLGLGLQVLHYTAQQLNNYLKNIEAAHKAHRRLFQHQANDSRYRSMHRHIPQRVWQRRSALLTMLEARQQAALIDLAMERGHRLAVPVIDGKTHQGGYSFNVLQVKSLPVWASNFADMDLIEHELDYFSLPALTKKAV